MAGGDGRLSATVVALTAKRTAAKTMAPPAPATPDSVARVAAHRISPRYSAWGRNECVVARMPLEVHRLTQIVVTVRTRGMAMPRAAITAATACTRFGVSPNKARLIRPDTGS